MNLDEELTELLASLGVVLEAPGEPSRTATPSARPQTARALRAEAEELPAAASLEPEVSLFQTSREHFGVFYRLDLVAGAPQLRIFVPEDAGAVKMRCFLVCPAVGTPIHEWFSATRAHDGSTAFLETREHTEQHLLFAAGESLKRLFWAGEPEEMRFPTEIAVARLL